MIWFLERIQEKTLPISFGIRSKREHPEDFAKLIKKGVLKRAGNLSEIECSKCHNDQLWQVREKNGEIFYICQNRCGKILLTDNEVALFEYNNTAFLKLFADEFGIKTDSDDFSDRADYSEESFYHIGMGKNKKVTVEVYYLRTDAPYEPSSLFEHMGNGIKVLITNTARPAMVSGKENTRYCILADTLAASSSKNIFDVDRFKKYLDVERRVRFDAKNGNLFLDDKLIYTAGLNSPEYYFLSCLWERWQEQVSHDDIHDYVREAMGKGVSDRPQIFCPKMKSSIKKKCAVIEKIITNPTHGHYFMSDPRE